MTSQEIDQILNLLDDHDLDGPGIDTEKLRRSTLSIPQRQGTNQANNRSRSIRANSLGRMAALFANDRIRISGRERKKDVVLVCAGGGHLEQMLMLHERLPIEGRRRWITVDSVQTRSLLRNEDAEYLPEVLGASAFEFSRCLVQHLAKSYLVGSPKTTAAVVSSGSSIALAYLPYSAVVGIPTYYIESAACTDEPSLTGKALEQVPGISLYTQHSHMQNSRWTYCGGSVLDKFEPMESTQQTVRLAPICGSRGAARKKIFVSLGLNTEYGFHRLLNKLQNELANPEFEVIWQVGPSNEHTLRFDQTLCNQVKVDMPYDELQRTISAADLVIAHAGTGIALAALELGKRPLLVPRDHQQHELKNDIQTKTAEMFTNAGLAATVTVENITAQLLHDMANHGTRIRRRPVSDLKLSAA